jgi:hypothetical protein
MCKYFFIVVFTLLGYSLAAQNTVIMYDNYTPETANFYEQATLFTVDSELNLKATFAGRIVAITGQWEFPFLINQPRRRADGVWLVLQGMDIMRV